MTFAEQLAADAALFVNPAEFGAAAEFMGATINLVAEPIAYEPAKHGPEGYNIERMRLFVAAGDLAEVPVPNQMVIYKDAGWFVANVYPGSVVVIEIERNIA